MGAGGKAVWCGALERAVWEGALRRAAPLLQSVGIRLGGGYLAHFVETGGGGETVVEPSALQGVGAQCRCARPHRHIW